VADDHHRRARAFLHCSSTAVYKPAGHQALAEDAPLGDNHGVWSFLSTYSISKIATEAMARWGARRYQLPTTIARLSVPYGDRGGWPAIHLEMVLAGNPIAVHANAPSIYHPIHERDIVAMVPGPPGGGQRPCTVVNWGGSDPVSIEEWCGYFGELTGKAPSFEPTDQTLDSVAIGRDEDDRAARRHDRRVARRHAPDGPGAPPRALLSPFAHRTGGPPRRAARYAAPNEVRGSNGGIQLFREPERQLLRESVHAVRCELRP